MQQPSSASAAQGPRMSLANVTTRHKRGARRICLYGVEGIGKTTWAADAPAPVFIAPENGYPAGIEPPAFPEPKTWKDVGDAVEELIRSDHNFKTVVFDTMDWIVRDHLFPWICAKHNKTSIDAFEFGAGYKFALAELMVLLGKLDRLRTIKGMTIVLLAHSEQKTYQNPTGSDYDRFILKMNERLSSVIREWVDILLFANFQVLLKGKRKEGDERALNERAKIKGGGARIVFTTPRPEAQAKNRDDLPDTMALDYAELMRHINASPAEKAEKADKIRVDIRVVLQQLADPKKVGEVEAWLGKIGNDLNKLSGGLNRLQALLAERAADQESQEIVQQQIAAGIREETPSGAAPAPQAAAPTPTPAPAAPAPASASAPKGRPVPVGGPVDLPEPEERPLERPVREDLPEDTDEAWDGFQSAPPPQQYAHAPDPQFHEPPPPAEEPPAPAPAAPPPAAIALAPGEPKDLAGWTKLLYACASPADLAPLLERLNVLRKDKVLRFTREEGASLRAVVDSVKVKLGMEPSQPQT